MRIGGSLVLEGKLGILMKKGYFRVIKSKEERFKEVMYRKCE